MSPVGPSTPTAPASQRAARILVAEDDPAAADVLQALLSRVGHQVEIAGDGATALQMLDSGSTPDILILDWMLPVITGLEICRLVRQRWDPLTLPILMVTAKMDAESISAAFEAGVSDYLTKPFLGSELRARIAAHLHVKRLLEERRRMEEHMAEREKLSTLGLLVSGVAHDLNNPLGGISGQAQLLLEEETDPGKTSALRHILGEVQRAKRIVGDLLSFARRQPIERKPVDVGKVLQATLRLREQQLRGVGLRTTVEIDADLQPVMGDPYQLQQVFMNILVNAEHALRHGGERIEVRAKEAPPSTARPMTHQWIQVSFYNDGPPIPSDLLPRIFDPFFTTKNRDEGTGLGLSICRRIVREHGGEIDVESGDEGTKFRILLPGEGGETKGEG